jgi:hypothetical protein
VSARRRTAIPGGGFRPLGEHPRAKRALWARLRPLPLAAALLALAVPAVAPASPQLQTGISDDGILLHSPERAPAIVARWAAAGIDTVRIQVRWVAAAPGELDPTQPLGFDARDPDDPQYDWAATDQAIALVVANGMAPLLTVTGSGPLWASRVPSLGNPRYQPDPVKFGQFAEAVARRYGRVADRYVIWNEPNQPLWLQPQQECPVPGRKCTPVAPHTYRALVRAAYPAIHRADPGAQVIAGALAPRGADPLQRNRPLRPLAFIRAFGCVDDRYKPVRTGRCRGFQPARIDGFAYHPHAIKASPSTPSPRTDDATIADLRKLEDSLDAVQRAHGFTTPTGAHTPLHLTEFGYQTNPPDPYDGIPPARQSRWLQEAAYVAWRDPRVRTLVQYEWQDEAVKSVGAGRKRYAGWQSGLVFANGKAKPALAGFQHPFFADVVTLAPRVRFWGQVRPGRAHAVALQRRSPSGSWVTIARLKTDTRGVFVKTLLMAGGKRGAYRYRTVDPLPAPAVVSDVVTVTGGGTGA